MELYGLFGKRVTDILKEKNFTLSVEIVPLRNGRHYAGTINKIAELSKSGIDFASVTKGAGGSLRAGTLPLSYFIREKFRVNTIAHFTCREYSMQEIENELIDHHMLGVKNILALRGDPPVEEKNAGVKGDYEFAWQLVRQINAMNNGVFLKRNENDVVEERTDFCIGVACYPERELEKEIEFLGKKVEEGAEYAITQMVFEAEKYEKFVDACKAQGIDIPIIPGIRPLVKESQCRFTEEFFKLSVPDELKKALSNDNPVLAREAGIDSAIRLCSELKQAKAPGAHFFIINDIDAAREIIYSLNGRSHQTAKALSTARHWE